jgi:hypothetical protein
VFNLGSEIVDFSGKMTSIGEGNCKTVRIGMRERERERERERGFCLQCKKIRVIVNCK